MVHIVTKKLPQPANRIPYSRNRDTRPKPAVGKDRNQDDSRVHASAVHRDIILLLDQDKVESIIC